jgi:uncharacterized protein (DUF924 family)
MTDRTTGVEREPADVLGFWRSSGPERWFASDDAFDAAIRTRFLSTYEAAAAGKLHHWEATAEGAFALVIVLDQFARNMFRKMHAHLPPTAGAGGGRPGDYAWF